MSRPPWSWHLLRAGTLRLDGGGMFGVVPRTIWSKLTPPDDLNRIVIQTNCLLLRRDRLNVLVEAGSGDKWNDRERSLYGIQQRTIADALAEIDVSPETITHVIVTHLHFDHSGGLTRFDPAGKPVATFPRAPVFVQRIEWEDALANKSTMTRTYLRNHLDPIADRLRLLNGESEISDLPGISVLPVPGHTWGLQAVIFRDEQGTVCFPGDVIPTIHHAAPAFSLGYDMMPYQNMLTKKALLDRAHRDQWRLVLDHEPGPPVVRVVQHPEKPVQFSLEPVG